MPQIWWCIQIFHFLISFFNHFSKWSAGVSIHVWTTISMRFNTTKLMVRPTSVVWNPFLQMAPRCEVYVVCSCSSFCYALCCIDPCLMWDLVFLLVSWFLLDVTRNHLWDVLVVMIRHVFVWDPFVVMLMGYSCVAMYVCIEIRFIPCWRDAHYHHAWV